MFRTEIAKIFMKSLIAMALVAAPMFAAKAADEPKYKLIIHVTQEDKEVFKQVLNIANNLPKQVGVDNVKMEIVAQGPGLKLLTQGSPETVRIASLVPYDNVQFSACGATMKGIKKHTGKDVVLLPDVKVVPGGVLRVMELEQQGWAYIRP